MKWLFKKMGLVDKIKQQEQVKPVAVKATFTDKEAAFIIAKLRQATYQGVEFEQFYQIMAKLQEIVEKK